MPDFPADQSTLGYKTRRVEEKGFCLSDVSDFELIKELQNRDISFGATSSDILSLVDQIHIDIHQELCVKNRVIGLIDLIRSVQKQ